MSKIERFLFFVLILLIPSQLSVHYWPVMEPVRIDYHAITFFVTDLISMMLIFAIFIKSIGSGNIAKLPKPAPNIILIGVFICLNVVFSQSPLLSLYKYVQLLVMSYLSFRYLHQQTGRKIFYMAFMCSLVWISIIGLVQVVINRSIGGWTWWLGERPLSIVAQGVTSIDWGAIGYKTLRPYSTFPHPNALAGYLLIGIMVLVQTKKSFGLNQNKLVTYIRQITITLSSLLLILTASVSSNTVGGLALIFSRLASKIKLKQRQYLYAALLLILCLVIAVHYELRPISFFSRLVLLRNSIDTIIHHPIFGTGFGAYLYGQSNPISTYYFFQPVHNAVVLLIAELGLPLVLLLVNRLKIVLSGQYANPVRLILICLLVLSLFDHYWLTSHANMFLLVIVICLGYIPAASHDAQQHHPK